MSTYEKRYNGGHPVLAIVLGLLGIVAAVLLILLAGVVGAVIAGLLGLAAILVGLAARKSGRGVGGITLGIIAILMSVFICTGVVSALSKARDVAKTIPEAPLVAKYLDNPNLGILGIALKVPRDEASMQELIDQLNYVNSIVDKGTAPEAAPAAN